MRTIPIDELLANIRRRKAELGITDDEATTEAMRNKGGSRTPEKRELLRRIEERAKSAGVKPIKSYY